MRLLRIALASSIVLVACDTGTQVCADSTCGGGGAGASGGAGGSGGAGATGGGGSLFGGFGGSSGCDDANPCPQGETCNFGLCCAIPCGVMATPTCCDGGDVCSFQQCVTPGDECVDASDCPPGNICDFSLGAEPMGGQGGMGGGSCSGGFVPQKGKCMPKPPECDPLMDPGDPPTCLPKCEYVPPSSSFDVTLKHYWGQDVAPPYSTDVMMTPIVIQLDDDNCDGKVNEQDIPEIVFSTFTGGGYYKQGTLHAISIVDGQLVEKWTLPNAVQPGGGLAAGDLDGDGVPEVVGCGNPGPAGVSCCDALAQNTPVVAFKADGSPFWTQADTSKVHCGYEAPAIGDVDHDGKPEVLVGFTILDGATGAVKKELDPATSWGVRLSSFADLDGDGFLDVTDGQRAYRADGTLLWDLRGIVASGYHAVGDLDLDGSPEVVISQSSGPHTLTVVKYDPAQPSGALVVRQGIDLNDGTSTAAFCNAASEYGGGPPTIADFDGDGFPDVGVAGAVGYVVFSGDLLMDLAVPNDSVALWFKTTHDCSSAVTGSAVFDFNGDGKAEVVYSDEYHLWMYDGVTGQNLIQSVCNTTGTLWEYPVVADVDNDGQADLIVASNAYGITCPDDGSKQSGIRVYGSATGSWVRTRRVWNQHTYHVTNVTEAGGIPAVEPPNWTATGLNNFRQNRQPGSEFAAPDATVSIDPKCTGEYGLVATVRNLGSAALPKGVVVGFYSGMPGSGTLLGKGTTTKDLFPAEAEAVVLLLPMSPDVENGTVGIYAVVDDTMDPHTWVECNTMNNVSAVGSGLCGMIN